MTTTHAAPPQVGPGATAAHSNWVVFAAVVLGVAGIMRIFDAIWAFRYDGALPEGLQNAVFGTELDTYGWIYLLVAAMLILAALAVLQGSQVGRWVGVGAGVVAAVSAMPWMPYYPIWTLTYVGLASAVIYALVAHSGESAS